MRKRIRGLLGVAALAVVALLSYPAVSVGSVTGEPVTAEFNYVGLYIGTTVGGDVDRLVYRPEDGPPLSIEGIYTDADGNFNVPKEGGFELPSFTVDLPPLVVDGKMVPAGESRGHYDQATGEMSLDLKLSMELGVDDLEALGEEIGIPLGTGQLTCEFAPLNVEAGTGMGWPHPGKAFEDKAGLVDGAIAGNWRSRPPAAATVGDQDVCNVIGGFLKPVGGIWLSNSSVPIDEMPPAEQWPGGCPLGAVAMYQLSCIDPQGCPAGFLGVYPDCRDPRGCAAIGKTGSWPGCRDRAARIGVVKLTRARIKAGKKGKVKVTLRNTGDAAFNGKIALRSNRRPVKVKKSVKVKVAAGKSKTVTVAVSTTRKAKGKATIIAKAGGRTGKGVVTVLPARKKRK